MDIGFGFSIERNSIRAAQEAINLARLNITKKPSLAIVFTSNSLASANLLKTISAALEDTPVIGASSKTIFSNQGVFQHGLGLLLISIPDETHFNTALIRDIAKKAVLAGEEMGEKLVYGFQDVHRSLSIILSDSLIEKGSGFISGLRERLGVSFPLIGAVGSDDRVLKSQLYFNQGLYKDACVGLLLGGKLNFGLGIKHGWKPLGKPHTVTKSSDNLVESIDGMPTVKFYQEYLGCDIAKLRKDLKQVSIFYPIGIYLEGEKEYLLRNIISIEAAGAMRFQGDIPQGSIVRLMIGTKETCLEATRQAAQEAKQEFFSNPAFTMQKKEGVKKFILAFSSLSRHLLLKREARKELEIIQDIFGSHIPILGLYSHGELAPLRAISYRGQVYFHNQTICVLVIGG